MTHKYFLQNAAGTVFGQLQSDVPMAEGDTLKLEVGHGRFDREGRERFSKRYTVKTVIHDAVIHDAKVIQTGKNTETEDTYYTFYATDVTTLVIV